MVAHSSLPQDNDGVAGADRRAIFRLEAILTLASMVPQEPVASGFASASRSCSCGVIAVRLVG